MKQYITLEQLNELSDEGIRKLSDFMGIEEAYNSVASLRKSEGEYGDTNLILSIGEMIEFLDEQKWEEELEIGQCVKGWYVGDCYYGDNYNGKIWVEKELCDALWEAVKKVL